MMKRGMVLLVCSALAATGCATTTTSGATAMRTPEERVAARAVLAEYVQKLPAGSAIRVERATGRTLHGTLMKATDQVLTVQPRTRIPEPPVDVELSNVLSVTPESASGTNIGKVIGIGAAAGAGAALAVFLVIIAAFSD